MDYPYITYTLKIYSIPELKQELKDLEQNEYKFELKYFELELNKKELSI